MDSLSYHLVDVFSLERLHGNALAVVPDAAGLDEPTMRAVARELNQSETTFLFAGAPGSGADWQLRSFTAAGVEVFGAGHNALGAWWWLARAGRLPLTGARATFHQLLGGRVLPVEVERRDGGELWVTMTQAPPELRESVEDGAALAQALGLESAALQTPLSPAQVVSTGAAHLMVPVRDREVLSRLQPQPRLLAELLRACGGQGLYAFTLEGGAAYARFFNPTVGISEDPATGSAAGPLACFLRARGALPGDALTVHQGLELSRRSELRVRLEGAVVRLAGTATLSASGTLHLGAPASERPALDHFILEVGEPVAAARFFEALLGLAPVRLAEFEAGEVPFPSTRVSETLVVDLFPPRLWRGEKAQNPNHVCLSLSRAGFEAAVARLSERGVAITKTDPHNFGARGFGSSVYFDGPEQVSIELRHYEGA